MIAKNLRHRITLLKKGVGNDGFYEESWQSYRSNVAAGVTFLSGRDLIAANADHSAVVARIQVRFDAKITADMRVLFRDEIYTISAVLPDNESGLQWQTLLVEKGIIE